MLEAVDVGTQSLRAYEPSTSPAVIEAIENLGSLVRGLRVLHVNATPYGGGVAEILRSEIPILRDLGVQADWQIITGDDEFFAVTKKVHNALQGAPDSLDIAERDEFLAHAAENAAHLDADQYDVVVVHDPQPLPIPTLQQKGSSKWIWRCHIDTSAPNADTWSFLVPFLPAYDAAVFTLGSFVPLDLPLERAEIIPPAIDPESPKNVELPAPLAARVLEWIGVEFDRPLITQVSRFDPWKDPLGVIAAYQLVKASVPELQLVLAGSMALDDPQGWEIYRAIRDAAHGDSDIHVFTNLTGVGNIEVNALQRLAHVVVQKSIREGFGLVVSEALWKTTPVVAGHAGGIPLQLRDGAGGYLVDSVEDCARRIEELLIDADLRAKAGSAGQRVVRDRFLLPRLVADELRLYAAVVGQHPPPGFSGTAGLAGEPRDPVCGMRLEPPPAVRKFVDGTEHAFCSDTCGAEFVADPSRFAKTS